MAHRLQQKFIRDTTKALQESLDGVEQEELSEALEELVENHTEVNDPEQGRIYQITGQLMDPKRKEPLRVTLKNPTRAEVVSVIGPASVSAPSIASGDPNWETIGLTLLSIYSAVTKGRVVDIEPNMAFTYAVGWDMSSAGESTIHQDDLKERVMSESIRHQRKEEMSEQDIERAVWRLKQMSSITGENLLDFREKCTVRYR